MQTRHETGHSFDVNNICSAPVKLLALLLIHEIMLMLLMQIKMQTMLKKSVFSKEQ